MPQAPEHRTERARSIAIWCATIVLLAACVVWAWTYDDRQSAVTPYRSLGIVAIAAGFVVLFALIQERQRIRRARAVEARLFERLAEGDRKREVHGRRGVPSPRP
jgi:hypothetical protein